MDQLYFMYQRGINDQILDVEYDDVNEQFKIHPSEWVSTKTVIHSNERAIIMGSDNRGWVLYTDASASSYGIGWCFVAVKNGFCQNISYGSLSKCSIFMAEAYAVLQAIRFVNRLVGLNLTRFNIDHS